MSAAANSSPPTTFWTTPAELRETYLKRERTRKIEMGAVGFLWLIGCPLLCLLPSTRTGSLWGTPDEFFCGLTSYSVSASMTGQYPKVFGSIMAPLFAVLVVQRTSNGLCPVLKLGWLSRFSPLVGATRNDAEISTQKKQEPSTHTSLARDLWKRLENIEALGYLTGSCLVGLVILDSKYFPGTHSTLALISFFSLNRQNLLVGTLGIDYPQLFPTWTTAYGKRFYFIGMFHLILLVVPMFFFFGPMSNQGRCGDVVAFMESLSSRLFGSTDTLRSILSVAYWYNEYAFGLISIYVQLDSHYEIQLWEWAKQNIPYIVILPRFSISNVLERVLSGPSRKLDADLLLGLDNPEVTGQKAKRS